MILDFFLRVKWLGALWAFKLFLTTVLKSCTSLNTNERKSTCCKLHIYMAWNRCKESSVAWDDLSYKSLFHSNHMASRFLCLNEMEQRSLKHKTTTQNSNTISSAQVMKKNINEGITSWSCTNFSKLESQELYGRQKSELLMRFQEWKGYWVKCSNYFFSISYRYHFDTFLFQNLPYTKIKFLWIKMHFRRYAAFSLEYSLIVFVQGDLLCSLRHQASSVV